MSNRRHPAKTPPRCPDCTARGWQLRHDDTCPLALAGDAQRARDREHMATHGLEEYSRPITVPEVVSARIGGQDVPLGAVVTVRRIGPGLTVRMIEWAPC